MIIIKTMNIIKLQLLTSTSIIHFIMALPKQSGKYNANFIINALYKYLPKINPQLSG